MGKLKVLEIVRTLARGCPQLFQVRGFDCNFVRMNNYVGQNLLNQYLV